VIPRVVVAANWKMHKGPDDTRAFLAALRPSAGARRPLVVVFPPAVSLAAALAARPRGVELGVQNIHWEDQGAFTGEISAPLARAAGAEHALVGHSERRQLFGESDADVARKGAAALRAGLTPMVCVGETLAERRAGRLEAVILRQLDAALEGLTGTAGGARFHLAYEPVWAIGTGETATPADAEAAHGILRGRLRERLGPAASGVPILYGGSVKPENAAELMAAGDVDGVLVGGASLDPSHFAAIVDAAPDR
jgi:triosephosphate isomerase